MILSIKRLKSWFKVIGVIILFTLLFYQVINFFSSYFEDDVLYRKPKGDALKVFSSSPNDKRSLSYPYAEIKERLMKFYLLGE